MQLKTPFHLVPDPKSLVQDVQEPDEYKRVLMFAFCPKVIAAVPPREDGLQQSRCSIVSSVISTTSFSDSRPITLLVLPRSEGRGKGTCTEVHFGVPSSSVLLLSEQRRTREETGCKQED